MSVKNLETGFIQVIQAYEVPVICNDLVGQNLQYVKKSLLIYEESSFLMKLPLVNIYIWTF